MQLIADKVDPAFVARALVQIAFERIVPTGTDIMQDQSLSVGRFTSVEILCLMTTKHLLILVLAHLRPFSKNYIVTVDHWIS